MFIIKIIIKLDGVEHFGFEKPNRTEPTYFDWFGLVLGEIRVQSSPNLLNA